MTNHRDAQTAPERIWTTGNEMSGSWNATKQATSRIDLGEVEYIRADLDRADTSARAGTGAVKPLVWTEYETDGWADRADAEAGSFGVFYNIDIQPDGYRVVFDREAVGAIGTFDTADEAKAAAQADYERRILAALQPGEAQGVDPVAWQIKPLAFDWQPKDRGNPSEMIIQTDDYSAYVLIPYGKGHAPRAGIGTWNGVANHKGETGFPTREAAMRYCEDTIRADAERAVKKAMRWIEATPPAAQVTVAVIEKAFIAGADWQSGDIPLSMDEAIAALQPGEAKGAEPLSLGRVKVPEGQTPLNDKLGHRLLDVFNEGIKARDAGTGSPYHGHSLEGCIHAAGWVQRDLRLALNSAHAALRALAGDGRRRQMKALIVGGPNRGQVVDIEVTPASVLELVEVCDRVRGESFWFKVEADVQDKHEYVMRELCRAYEYLMKGETHRQHVKKNGKL